MKKNLLALLLALAMMMTLVACGGKEEPKEEVEEKPSVEEPAPEESEEPAEEPAPEEKPAEPAPEEKPEEKPADPAPEEKPEEKPAEPAPEEKPEEKPADPAPEEKPEEKPAPEAPSDAVGVDLGAFYESVASGTADWPGMMPLEGEMLDAFYAGLTGIATKQCGVYMPMMSSVVCEIALVEVENAADVQAVKDIFQARINYQVGDETNPGGAWYPESIEGWKNHSRVVSNGNCVMMVAFSGADAIVEAFNALF